MASSFAHSPSAGGTSCFSRPTRRFRIDSSTPGPRTVHGPLSSMAAFTCMPKILHSIAVAIARSPHSMISWPHGSPRAALRKRTRREARRERGPEAQRSASKIARPFFSADKPRAPNHPPGSEFAKTATITVFTRGRTPALQRAPAPPRRRVHRCASRDRRADRPVQTARRARPDRGTWR